MINFFKRILGLFLQTEHERFNRGTGVIPFEGIDERDISAGAVVSAVDIPDSFDGFGSILQSDMTFDQIAQSDCTANAMAMLERAYIFRKTGQRVNINPRFAYGVSKLIDGLPYESGTYARIAAKVFASWGCATTSALSYNPEVSPSDYRKFDLTDALLDDACRYKLPGFAFVEKDLDSLKTAIFVSGMITATLSVGNWHTLPVKRGKYYHHVLVYGYETLSNGDCRFYFKNSWGNSWLSWIAGWAKPGYGYFNWSDYKDDIQDMIVFTDIPADLLTKVKNMRFKFTKTLTLGQSDMQVKELQKMLNTSPETTVALEGPGSIGKETYYFGTSTKSALVRWQAKNGIEPRSGYFGPLSLKKANEGIYSDKLAEWANAIKTFEGWGVGTRSYKNNNPGNIKYTGIFAQMAKGKDDKGFCMFETYDKGFDALLTLLRRAATGLSSVYKPDMTLLKFYETYAPAEDNNHPLSYASFVAKRIGVSVDTKIKDLL